MNLSCGSIQKKLNEAALKGQSQIILEDEDVTHKELDNLLDCGFLVKSVKRDNGTEYFVISK